MEEIDHIVVLMLENRSFDHMLGLLDHPRRAEFPHAFLKGDESNPDRDGQPVPVWWDAAAPYGVRQEPGHTHAAVKQQIENGMQGFVRNHQANGGPAKEVMRVNLPVQVPVLSELARQYLLCTRWHCSVPGATWPNRFFAMAGQSRGHMDNGAFTPPVDMRSLFHELPDDAWRIYHDGPCLALLMRGMYGRERRDNYRPLARLFQDIENAGPQHPLPRLSWVEPDHFGIDSSSQHPGFMNGEFDHWAFTRGEQLIAQIHDALQARPEIFRKTLFVITYDEHGGFYDHVTPPATASAPDPKHAASGLPFNVYGPRVPAVLVNPLIPPHSIDDALYDHASLVRMVGDRFGLDLPVFGQRVLQAGNPLANREWLPAPRDKVLLAPRPVPERPKEWRLALADHLDDLMLSLLLGLQEVTDTVANIPDLPRTNGINKGFGVPDLAGQVALAQVQARLRRVLARQPGQAGEKAFPASADGLKALRRNAGAVPDAAAHEEPLNEDIGDLVRDAVKALLNVSVPPQ